MCKIPIQIGTPWDVSHPIPLAAGGKDDESNWFPAHRSCHKYHTHNVDTPLIAKVRRQWAKHVSGKAEPRMRSAGFRKAQPQNRASTPLNKWKGF